MLNSMLKQPLKTKRPSDIFLTDFLHFVSIKFILRYLYSAQGDG